MSSSLVFAPGPQPRTVLAADGAVRSVPAAWGLLPPGDAGLTRRVKAAGDHWVVQERKGRKFFSRGVWAPTETIERLRTQLLTERGRPEYAKRLAAGARRRDRVQQEYVGDFRQAIVDFLAFLPEHATLAARLAEVVAIHATPVGSGTVARTKRISIERSAEAAVIAWMRHQTTGYDQMKIPRVAGQRREVRRMLAKRSHELLAAYRGGVAVSRSCPLLQALVKRPSQRE